MNGLHQVPLEAVIAQDLVMVCNSFPSIVTVFNDGNGILLSKISTFRSFCLSCKHSLVLIFNVITQPEGKFLFMFYKTWITLLSNCQYIIRQFSSAIESGRKG